MRMETTDERTRTLEHDPLSAQHPERPSSVVLDEIDLECVEQKVVTLLHLSLT
jgi:hypothetical protein